MAKTPISTALQKLAQRAGFQRSDLLKALDGELSALRDCWHIDTKNGSVAASRIVYENLNAHIERLEPRPTRKGLSDKQREEQYRHAVKTCFYILKHEELNGTNLSGRQKWLAKAARGEPLQIEVPSSRRDLEHAIAGIEQQILSAGYAPIAIPAVELSASTFELPSYAAPSAVPEQVHQATKRNDRLRTKLVLTGSVALLGIIALMATPLWLDQQGAKAISGSRPAAASGPPIAYTVTYGDTNPKDCSDGLNYVYPISPDKMPSLPVSLASLSNTTYNDSFMAYAAKNHGAFTGGSMMTLTIQGTGASAAVLNGLEAKVTARHPVIVGSSNTNGGCGADPPRTFGVQSLDQSKPRVVPDPGVTDFPYQVTSADSEVFHIFPEGVSSDVDWELLLDWSYQGKTGQLIINDGGRPFHYDGGSAAQAGYFDRSGKWTSMGH